MVTAAELSADILAFHFYNTGGTVNFTELHDYIHDDANIYSLVLLALALRQGLRPDMISGRKLNKARLADMEMSYYSTQPGVNVPNHVVVDLSALLHDGEYFTFIGHAAHGRPEFIKLAHDIMWISVTQLKDLKADFIPDFDKNGVETIAQLAAYVNRQLSSWYYNLPEDVMQQRLNKNRLNRQRRSAVLNVLLAILILALPLISRYATMLMPPLIIVLFYRLWHAGQPDGDSNN